MEAAGGGEEDGAESISYSASVFEEVVLGERLRGGLRSVRGGEGGGGSICELLMWSWTGEGGIGKVCLEKREGFEDKGG